MTFGNLLLHTSIYVFQSTDLVASRNQKIQKVPDWLTLTSSYQGGPLYLPKKELNRLGLNIASNVENSAVSSLKHKTGISTHVL